MSTWSDEDRQVSIKFNSGGLEQLIKARESEDVEIDRLDTMDGEALSPIQVNEVALDGRRIFLKSKWEIKINSGERLDMAVASRSGNDRSTLGGFPMELISQSHEQAQTVNFISQGPDSSGNTSMMMLAQFDRPRTIRIYGNGIKFRPTIDRHEYDTAFLKVCLSIYENGINYNLKERRVLFHSGSGSTSLPNFMQMHNNLYSINLDQLIDVEEGDSVALEFNLSANLTNGGGVDNRMVSISLYDLDGDVYCEEDSFFEPSKAKFIFIHDILERLTTICSSMEGSFYSKYFGRTELGYPVDGPGAMVGGTHGFWIRQFDKLPLSTPIIQNLFKPLTTSLRDSVNSCHAVFNVGMGIEEINNRERVRIEPLSYFYNSNVTIKLPNQVKKLKRSISSEHYCSAIEIGYDNGGIYSEAQGLDEPNGKTNWTTTITRVKKTFSKISNFRADSYGKEFARRKPVSRYDSLDTQYDEDKWLLDLKRGLGSVFLERKWQDDFSQQPTGIFAPDTATNLRLSPFNMMLHHGYIIASGLSKYPLDYIRYGSSTANSQLKTKLIGGNEYSENGNIINSELGTPRFVNEYIDFEHECDFDIMQQVQGTTVILGNEIPNFYGTVEFINENGDIEKGFLISLKPNAKGQWRLLKSIR
ncbi:MAG: hypothetical protein M0D53_09350 [Flavobacterium sp. JAD_PAG50586_2]|nr:MAG: hypothetical protein M0D53_09350 [Flavobacterium sp. JAD_PAG50586_2]